MTRMGQGTNIHTGSHMTRMGQGTNIHTGRHMTRMGQGTNIHTGSHMTRMAPITACRAREGETTYPKAPLTKWDGQFVMWLKDGVFCTFEYHYISFPCIKTAKLVQFSRIKDSSTTYKLCAFHLTNLYRNPFQLPRSVHVYCCVSLIDWTHEEYEGRRQHFYGLSLPRFFACPTLYKVLLSQNNVHYVIFFYNNAS